MPRLLRILIQFIGAALGIVLVLSALLVWRLSQKPLTADFMAPYLERAVERMVPDSKVTMDDALLVWDNIDHSITLHASDLKVSDAQGDVFVEVPSLHARISAIGLVLGQFMPRALIIDHPQIKLTREVNGELTFNGKSMAAGNEADKDTPLTESLQKAADSLSGALLMSRLSVTRAVIDVVDAGSGKDWAIGIPEISIRRTGIREVDHKLEFGALEGKLTVEVSQYEDSATLQIDYDHDPLAGTHRFALKLNGLNPAQLAGGHPENLGLAQASIVNFPLNGTLGITLNRDFTVTKIDANLNGDEGNLVYADFWDQPVPVKKFDLNAAYDRKTHSLTIGDTKVDFYGPVLALSANGTAATTPGQDLDIAAILTVDNLPMNRYAEIWPKPVLPNPRYWLEANLRNGMFTRAEVNLKATINLDDLANATIVDGGGKVLAVGGRVNYLDGMPPINGVNAEATFDLKKMDVKVTAGSLGNIKVKPFSVSITGLADYDQYIDIPLQVTGPISEVLALIDHPPLGYAKKLGISPEDVQGYVEGSVEFKFPLLKTLLMQDVSIKADAKTTDVTSSRLVPGVDISQGNFALNLDTSGFALKGQSLISKVPFQITWQENFESKPGQPLRRATVTGPIRDDQWPLLGINSFAGSKGASQAYLEMAKPDKKTLHYSGTLDMSAAAIRLDELGWNKPAGESAVLKFTATSPVGGKVSVRSLDITGEKTRVRGTAVLSPDLKQILSVNMPQFVLGRSNANVKMNQSFGPKGSMTAEVKGAAFDLGSMQGDDDDKRTKKFQIKVDRLYMSEAGFIDKMQGSAIRDAQGWSEISLHGLADGTVPLSIELTPEPSGIRKLLITSPDFGKAMKGLGFNDRVKGGKLWIAGESTLEAPRQIKGRVKIGSFTVVNLPLLALLINSTSPFGFAGILTDSADFSRLESEFTLTGDNLMLAKAHAAGSAMGINAEGRINMVTGDATLQGTLVPFSVVNKIINYIPIIGEIVTGGENQGVLAVSYKIDGSLDDPRISVNPVSLLTPGFIRNLFFHDEIPEETPQPDKPQTEKEKK